MAELIPPYEGATLLGPTRREIAIVEGEMSPSKTSKLKRAGIRETTTNGRIGPPTLPRRSPCVMELSASEIMKLRPLDARTSANVAGTWPLLEACEPALMARKRTLA